MTLPELRVLAERAKAWRPWVCCDSEHTGRPICFTVRRKKLTTEEARESTPPPVQHCLSCEGGHRAVEDIALEVNQAVDNAAAHLNKTADDSMCNYGPTAVHHALLAKRVASYFGSHAPVAAFEAAVREMCRG